jgi:murein L,D-transpeptidase YcbB/YkuD
MLTPRALAGISFVRLTLIGALLTLSLHAAAEPLPFAAAEASAPERRPPEATAEASPLLIEVRRRAAAAHGEADGAALAAFYAQRSGPLWVSEEGLNAKARHAMAEIARADDWGLDASAFALPQLGPGAPALSALAAAEVQLSRAVLKYARYARGGRVDVANFSRLVDREPNPLDGKVVLEAVAASETPGDYLTGLQPRHPQFALLRQALLRVRAGGSEPAPQARPWLPDGPLLKPGMRHPTIALLRHRLQVSAVAGEESLYDAALLEAVKAYQRANGMGPDGVVGARARAALNGGERKPALFGEERQRIVLNMERWRWMPEDLGELHVWNNVPEFLSRVLKNGVVVHAAKIVIGKPDTPTVQFSANMRFIVFHPEWGVPDSIKIKEILPYLRPSGGDFFGLFGGTDTRILQRHNLKVSYNGRPVDPSQVDWTQVDVRRYAFVQPGGAGNVLGVVKFRFPNRHDIYMHDTPQRELFEKETRAFSHGCIRVSDPGRLAELLLAEDKGWSSTQVQGLLKEGYNNEVTLERQIPVHVTYFTAVARADGSIGYFGDIYAQDARLSAALRGQPLPLEVAPGEEGAGVREARRAGRPSKQTGNDFLSGLFGN